MNGKIFVKIFNKLYDYIYKITGYKKIIKPQDIIFEKGYYINNLNNKKKISMVKVFVLVNGEKIQLKDLKIPEEVFYKYYDLFINDKIEIYYDLTYDIYEGKRRKINYGFRKIKSIKPVLRM